MIFWHIILHTRRPLSNDILVREKISKENNTLKNEVLHDIISILKFYE
uniref:Uncharacterized protein n=1 Tax=Lepeophtheirus salmonis TaxID=72036 RepID=A0A0K2U681_LEPSM